MICFQTAKKRFSSNSEIIAFCKYHFRWLEFQESVFFVRLCSYRTIPVATYIRKITTYIPHQKIVGAFFRNFILLIYVVYYTTRGKKILATTESSDTNTAAQRRSGNLTEATHSCIPRTQNKSNKANSIKREFSVNSAVDGNRWRNIGKQMEDIPDSTQNPRRNCLRNNTWSNSAQWRRTDS